MVIFITERRCRINSKIPLKLPLSQGEFKYNNPLLVEEGYGEVMVKAEAYGEVMVKREGCREL